MISCLAHTQKAIQLVMFYFTVSFLIYTYVIPKAIPSAIGLIEGAPPIFVYYLLAFLIPEFGIRTVFDVISYDVAKEVVRKVNPRFQFLMNHES